MKTLKLICFPILFILLVYTSVARADIEEAREVLVATIDRIYSDLGVGYSDESEWNQAAEDVIRREVLPVLNVNLFSKLILASHWKTSSAAQREKFTDVLSEFLVRTFVKAIAADRDLFESFSERINFDEPTPGRNENRAVVNMTIDSPNGDITIAYRMARSDSGWQLYDVVFQGVSFAINYRSILKAEIKRHGIDSVTNDLEDKLKLMVTT